MKKFLTLFKLIFPIFMLSVVLSVGQAKDVPATLTVEQIMLPVLEDPSRFDVNMAVLWREDVIELKENRRLQVQILRPKEQGTYPIVVFSGGWSVNFRHYSQILTDLASKGYVIVNIDHYYQKDTVPHTVEFDDSVASMKIELENQDAETKIKRFMRTKFHALEIYYKDYLFVLRHLREILIQTPSADFSKIVLMGHSLGGNTAQKTLENFNSLPAPRDIKAGIKAGIALDSRLNQLNLKTTFDKPLLLLGAEEEYKKSDPLREVPKQPNFHFVLLKHAGHVSFMDYVIYPILGKDTNLLFAGLNTSAIQATKKLIDKVKADHTTFFNGSPAMLVKFISKTTDQIDLFLKKTLD
jgi:dienelactone hydrolase